MNTATLSSLRACAGILPRQVRRRRYVLDETISCSGIKTPELSLFSKPCVMRFLNRSTGNRKYGRYFTTEPLPPQTNNIVTSPAAVDIITVGKIETNDDNNVATVSNGDKKDTNQGQTDRKSVV